MPAFRLVQSSLGLENADSLVEREHFSDVEDALVGYIQPPAPRGFAPSFCNYDRGIKSSIENDAFR